MQAVVAALGLLAPSSMPLAAQQVTPDTYATSSLPPWALAEFLRQGYADRLEVFLGINPFFVQGDFDGDGEADVALQVQDSLGRRGIAVIHSSDRSVQLLGVGVVVGNGGDDFSWLWVWRAEPGDSLPREPVLGQDVLYVAKPEAASGWFIWSGTEYVWRQGGD